MTEAPYLASLRRVLRCGRDDDMARVAARRLVGDHGHAADEADVDHAIKQALEQHRVATSRFDYDPSKRLGRLLTNPDGFEIRICRNITRSTYRFVAAHELAHTLSYDRSAGIPRRRWANSRAEEEFCDRVARHLLLPATSTRTMIESASLRGETVLRIAGSVAKHWSVPAWEVLFHIFQVRSVEDLVAVRWRIEPDLSATVLNVVKPRGLYIPTRNRSRLITDDAAPPWAALTVDGSIVNAEREVEMGSLQGTIRSAAMYIDGFVHEVFTLDEQHLSKAAQWRRKHGEE